MRALLLPLILLSLPALAAGLNDTGITFCGDASTNTANCASVAADTGPSPDRTRATGAMPQPQRAR